jgi:hypothetical protein
LALSLSCNTECSSFLKLGRQFVRAWKCHCDVGPVHSEKRHHFFSRRSSKLERIMVVGRLWLSRANILVLFHFFLYFKPSLVYMPKQACQKVCASVFFTLTINDQKT